MDPLFLDIMLVMRFSFFTTPSLKVGAPEKGSPHKGIPEKEFFPIFSRDSTAPEAVKTTPTWGQIDLGVGGIDSPCPEPPGDISSSL